MIIIPFVNYPAYTEDILIDEFNYRFRFVWNNRGQFWTLSILNANENIEIINGIKLVLNYELLKQYRYLKIPKGNLFVVDVSGNLSRIGYEDFINDRNLQILYLSPGETL